MFESALIVFALLSPPFPATPMASHVEWAVLPASGGPAELRYTTTCSPAAGTFYTLRVTLAQRTGRTVAIATGEGSGACTGLRQSLTLRAGAYAAFRPGRASVTSCLRVHNGLLGLPWSRADEGCPAEAQTTVITLQPARPGPVTA